MGPYSLAHEQIDGAFEYGGKYYIVESKWHDRPIGINEIQNFSTKVKLKLTNTIGIFVSISGYPGNINQSLSHSLIDRNIILFDKLDIEYVINGRISLPLLIDEKMRAASFEGKLYLKSDIIFKKLSDPDIIDHISIGREILEKQINKLQQKYDKELYVKRKIEQEIIKNLSAKRSDNVKKNILALIDRAGAGKTNILCNIAQKLSEKNVVIFVLGNIQIDRQEDLLNQINDHIRMYFERRSIKLSPAFFCDTLKIRIKSQHINFFLIIDGINENPKIRTMSNSIEFLATNFIDDDWFNILIACRDIYWEYFEKNVPLMNLTRFVVRDKIYEFEEREFQSALKKYLVKYSITVKLEGNAYEKCKHPLLLRFFCEAYKGMNLPPLSNLRLVELFEIYSEKKVSSIASKMPMIRHVDIEVTNFLYEIGEYMYGINNRYIPLPYIANILSNAYQTSEKDDIKHLNSIYTKILDEDIILEEIRSEQFTKNPFNLFHKDQVYVTFVYEEYMEYIIACSIEKKMLHLNNSQIIEEIEKIFDKEKSFINIFGIMLFLGNLLKMKRSINIWSKLYGKGKYWENLLLFSITKCPEELIDNEFIELLTQIAQRISKQFSLGYFDDIDEDYIEDDYVDDYTISDKPNYVLEILRQRKFKKFKNEIADILEYFLLIPDKYIRQKVVYLLGDLNTENSCLVLLKNYREILELNSDLKHYMIRILIKSDSKKFREHLIDFLPIIWDKDISNFFKKKSSFVRHNLKISKKDLNTLIGQLDRN
jgi:hypothetical protein